MSDTTTGSWGHHDHIGEGLAHCAQVGPRAGFKSFQVDPSGRSA